MNENPPDATVRIRADTVPAKLRSMRGRVGVFLLSAIDWALALEEKQRPQSVREWRDALQRQAPPVAPALTARPASETPVALGAPVPIGRAPGLQSPRVNPSAALAPARVRRPAARPAPTFSINVGWLALVIVLVGAGVWAATRSPNHGSPAEPLQGATGITFESATGPVNIPGTIVSVRNAQAEADGARSRPGDVPMPEPRVVTLVVPKAPDETAPISPQNIPEYQPARPAPERLFDDADANRDGFVSREEARRLPPLARNFDRMDCDGDGRLTADEFRRMRPDPPPPPPHFRK